MYESKAVIRSPAANAFSQSITQFNVVGHYMGAPANSKIFNNGTKDDAMVDSRGEGAIFADAADDLRLTFNGATVLETQSDLQARHGALASIVDEGSSRDFVWMR